MAEVAHVLIRTAKSVALSLNPKGESMRFNGNPHTDPEAVFVSLLVPIALVNEWYLVSAIILQIEAI